MAHTLEELESLLEGRALVGRVLREEPGVEPGADCVITDVDYFPLSRIVEMRFDAGRCTFTLKDVEKLLDGQKVGGTGTGKRWNKAFTLLPAEEEPAKAEEPTTEAIVFREPGDGGEAVNEYFRREAAKGRTEKEITKDFLEGPKVEIENGEYRWMDGAKREEPAKPALTAKWEERWWNACLRCAMAGGRSLEEAAAVADNVVAFARKHLEGEG